MHLKAAIDEGMESDFVDDFDPERYLNSLKSDNKDGLGSQFS